MKKANDTKITKVGEDLHKIMHRHGIGIELDLSFYSFRIKDNRMQIMPLVGNANDLDHPTIGFIQPCPETKRLFFT